MQTFLPEPLVRVGVSRLDNRRLGKQRVETLQIMKALAGLSHGWQTHPAVKMWRGYEHFLMGYQRAVCDEWKRRGFKDTCLWKTQLIFDTYFVDAKRELPWWWAQHWYRDRIVQGMRSNLIRKDPAHYKPFWPHVTSGHEYVWPVQ